MTISEKLGKVMRQFSINRQQLCELTGLDEDDVLSMLTKDRKLAPEEAKKLEKRFYIRASWFLEED